MLGRRNFIHLGFGNLCLGVFGILNLGVFGTPRIYWNKHFEASFVGQHLSVSEVARPVGPPVTEPPRAPQDRSVHAPARADARPGRTRGAARAGACRLTSARCGPKGGERIVSVRVSSGCLCVRARARRSRREVSLTAGRRGPPTVTLHRPGGPVSSSPSCAAHRACPCPKTLSLRKAFPQLLLGPSRLPALPALPLTRAFRRRNLGATRTAGSSTLSFVLCTTGAWAGAD